MMDLANEYSRIFGHRIPNEALQSFEVNGVPLPEALQNALASGEPIPEFLDQVEIDAPSGKDPRFSLQGSVSD